MTLVRLRIDLAGLQGREVSFLSVGDTLKEVMK